MLKIFNHLKDNTGDEYIEKLILIVIAFSIGAALFIILPRGFEEDGIITKWIGRSMTNAMTGEKIV